MAGRRRVTRGGTRGKPKTAVGLVLQDYFQPALHTIDFNGLASGGDLATTLVDNSADFANSILKWSKLTIRPIWDSATMKTLANAKTILMMILKRDQDSSTVPAIDNQEVVRELRNDKKIVRGPWWLTSPGFTTSGYIPAFAGHMKAIVLQDFMMDREEDLLATFTNVSAAFDANLTQLDFAMKGFVRAIK